MATLKGRPNRKYSVWLGALGVLATLGIALCVYVGMILMANHTFAESQRLEQWVHPFATLAFSALGLLACYFAARSEKLFGYLVALPFFALALLPLLGSPGADAYQADLAKLRSEISALKKQINSLEQEQRAASERLKRVRLIAGPTDWVHGTGGHGSSFSLGEIPKDSACFVTGVRGKWMGGGEHISVRPGELTWSGIAASQQPATSLQFACIGLP